jgi:hypothetical protein
MKTGEFFEYGMTTRFSRNPMVNELAYLINWVDI